MEKGKKEKKKISVISVCYNCEDEVEETLTSLLMQTYQNFEYIVVDGGSTDGTLEKIKSFTFSLSSVKIVSEPDDGIYDAMNKGVRLATGDFVYFLNIGDKFCDSDVLENVVSYLHDDNTIYFGDIIHHQRLYRHPNQLNDFYFLLEKMICHQSIFAPLKFLKQYPFRLEYSYCADRDWLLYWIKKEKANYFHMAFPIAIYDTEGFSSQNEKVSFESKKVLCCYYPKFVLYLVRFKNFVGKLLGRHG